jgi:two-component system, response regulator PdtaR
MGHGTHPLVLVVEDEPLVRMVAAEGLEDAGFEVLEAESAADALDILNRRPDVDFLFTDVNMPGDVDGVELARLVHERWPALRIVVTSGKDHVKKSDIPDQGRFVPKPYRTHEVVHLIEEMASAA